ncbi:hypothetical protein F5Y11DRAFT_352207 [Daldinia sp. FL1419]|nr:hypothetical protein F5Y11DRAFT_352207 [Daldinia sp. FL1419]
MQAACECEDVSVNGAGDHDSWTKVHEAYSATHHDVTKVDDTIRTEHEWHTWIRAYSKLNLTVVSDRLPAMSGLAQQAKEMRETHGIPTGGYLAGLWEKALLNDISWCVGQSRARIIRGEDGGRNWIHWTNNKERKTGATGVKPDDYVAPSWLWASVLSPVEFTPFGYKKSLCQLFDACVETDGPNEYGRATPWGLLGSEGLWTGVFNCVKDNGMLWLPDYDIQAEGKYKLPGTEKLYLLHLVSCPILGRDEDSDIRIQLYPGKTKVETVYLVLRRARPAALVPVFSRIGWAEYTGDDGDKVPDMTKARDTKFKFI